VSRLTGWIADHPVVAFFALTYVISWPAFATTLLLFPDSMVLQGTLGSLAVFAPALAAMLVAATCDPRREGANRSARRVAFAAVWLLATVTLVLFVWRVRGVPPNGGIAAFAAVLSILPAFTVSRAFSGVAGIRRHFATLLTPRGNPLWYAVALLTFPAVQLAGLGLTLASGAGSTESDLGPGPDLDAGVASLMFLNGLLFAGGVNEESGWRGFALPRLQGRFCPLVSALIVWIFWALWHLPMDLASGAPAASILTNRLLFNAMWSVLFAWVFNRTRGSVLAPALFHPAMNTSGDLLPATDLATLLFLALTVAAIASDRMWRRLPVSDPAVIAGDRSAVSDGERLAGDTVADGGEQTPRGER
jgi:membrane protease YdiL (CAAX protease family)